ncbi:DUF6879 family protein [Saccharopolyspora phatthalungensis]|uniref:DUF6879 domain-containing protein n=1 Tax=Saccharopolyspora phatthalungensis TaxID=664693 RepID=A0A840PUE9_9PSEU|nr:DUF6879 family protein [Saccharopolyspora phatthalungensis]MBB5153922.1 hypothetical protein [Saccharopolyspora phatthalungensis]
MWHETVRNNAAAGKTMQRIKFVRKPLTDYARFLFDWVIADNVTAGEDYRIVDLAECKVDLPAQDFWIFDESMVVLLNFNPDGTLRDREIIDPAHSAKCFEWRDLALKESVPFDEYRA